MTNPRFIRSLSPTSLGAIGAALLLTAACGLLAYTWNRGNGDLRAGHVLPGGPADPATEAEREGIALSGIPEAEVATRTKLAAEPATSPAPAEPRVRGRVLDVDGRPLAGLRIGMRSAGSKGPLSAFEGEAIDSSLDGTFELARPPRAVEIGVAAEGWTSLRLGVWRPGSRDEPLVVAARAVRIAGRVVDSGGATIDAAELELRLPDSLWSGLRVGLELSTQAEWRARSTPAGAFVLADVPSVPGGILVARKRGYAEARIPCPHTSEEALEMVLHRPAHSDRQLVGRVITAAGAPAPGARVAVGGALTQTDEHGEFRLDLERAGSADRLLALRPPDCPGILLADRAIDGSLAWPVPALVQLGGPASSIDGIVVDGSGRAVAGARVWIEDPTPFAPVDDMPTQVEFALHASLRAPEAAGEASDASTSNDASWAWAETDARGRFVLDGLLDRDYRVVAMHPESLEVSRAEAVPAGSKEIRLVLPALAGGTVAGVVVSTTGSPAAGIRITLARTAFESTWSLDGYSTGAAFQAWGCTVETDEQGRFELEGAPRSGCSLRLAGNGILPRSVPVPGGEDRSRLRIEVEVLCNVVVELGLPLNRADRVQIRDAGDAPLELARIDAGGYSMSKWATLTEGLCGPLSVPASAATVVLYKDSLEVGRIPFAPLPGQLVVLSF